LNAGKSLDPKKLTENHDCLKRWINY